MRQETALILVKPAVVDAPTPYHIRAPGQRRRTRCGLWYKSRRGAPVAELDAELPAGARRCVACVAAARAGVAVITE